MCRCQETGERKEKEGKQLGLELRHQPGREGEAAGPMGRF